MVSCCEWSAEESRKVNVRDGQRSFFFFSGCMRARAIYARRQPDPCTHSPTLYVVSAQSEAYNNSNLRSLAGDVLAGPLSTLFANQC